jgi:glycosyltransferase involved in cell wall biosynthesis
MYKMQTVAVVIPALNEANSIRNVVRELRSLNNNNQPLVDDIVVCDNGSTDNTFSMAQSAGARVVEESERGYGAACLAALEALKSPDIVVFVDADHSIVVQEIYALLDNIISGADLVVGSRVSNLREAKALNLPQRVGNFMASRLIQFLWRYPVSDLGPFRAIKYPCLLQLNMQDKRYGWTVEMQVKAIINKMIVIEVPVSSLKRIGKSKISGTLSGVIGAATGIFGMIFTLWTQRGSIKIQKNTKESRTIPFQTESNYTQHK